MTAGVEFHRFTFEGSTTLLAKHLVEDHGATPASVAEFGGGLTQGHWVALDDLHKAAHKAAHESKGAGA